MRKVKKKEALLELEALLFYTVRNFPKIRKVGPKQAELLVFG